MDHEDVAASVIRFHDFTSISRGTRPTENRRKGVWSVFLELCLAGR